MGDTKNDRLSTYAKIKRELSGYSPSEIEDGIMRYCLNDYHCNGDCYNSKGAIEITRVLERSGMETDIEAIIGLFESLLDKGDKRENGIVFTPQYVASYIATNLFENLTEYSKDISIIDPGCGCGIFLVTAAEMIASRFNIGIDAVINNNIYGIDIDEDNARRCVLVLRLLCAKHGCDYQAVTPNVLCRNSLKCDWAQEFGRQAFDYVIGNEVRCDRKWGAEYMLWSEKITEVEIESETRGKTKFAVGLVRKNLVTIKQAAEELGITEDKFKRLMENTK